MDIELEGCLLFALHLFLFGLIGSSDASCSETVYLERGVDGIIECSYEDYKLIHWSIAGDTRPLIVYENNATRGPGHNSRGYDILLNGSLIIRNVTQQHERQYSLGGFTIADKSLSSVATVRVFVRPIPEYPVINGMVNRQNILLKVERLWDMNCAMENVRPAISLEWVIVEGFPREKLVINNDTTTRDHVDGTSSIHLQSHFKMSNTSVRSLTILCVVIGPDVLSSATSADVLFPAVSNNPSLDPVSTALVSVIDGGCSELLDFTGKHYRQTTASLVILIMFILAFPVYFVGKLWIREMEKMRASAKGTENPESHGIVEMGMDRPPAAVEAPIDRHHSGTSANRAEALGSESKAEDETETRG